MARDRQINSRIYFPVVLTILAVIIISVYLIAFYHLTLPPNSPDTSLDSLDSSLAANIAVDLHYDIQVESLLGVEPLLLDGSERMQKWKHGQISWPPIKEYKESEYPVYKSLLNIINDWNPDNPDPPTNFRETLQHFNFSDPRERKLAAAYRDAEIPFKLYDVPFVSYASHKWSDEYLSFELSKSTAAKHVEKSDSNHFMYWAMKSWKQKRGKVFEPPTEIVTDSMDFKTWVALARKADQERLAYDKNMASAHYYFMTNAMQGDRDNSFVAKDLPVFSSGTKNFFIPKPQFNKGIQCRFGMRGIIAEAHYDAGRNMIAMLKGAKRYVLTSPRGCKQTQLISDPDHPSFRHSELDWSNATVAREHHFDEVDAIDTIVREGEVLYVPSFWIHYIISLEYTIQCNSRFGSPEDKSLFEPIKECFGWSDDEPPKAQGKLRKRAKAGV